MIGKLLENHLAVVIGSVASAKQFAFVKGRQILHGPMMLSEIISHDNVIHKKIKVFKVDFEKAYDSLPWDFLIEFVKKRSFINTWCQ